MNPSRLPPNPEVSTQVEPLPEYGHFGPSLSEGYSLNASTNAFSFLSPPTSAARPFTFLIVARTSPLVADPMCILRAGI